MRQQISTYHPTRGDLDPCIKKWFAVRTCFRWEKVVKRRLEEKNVEVYLPLLKVVRRYPRKLKRLEVPLINNFVFVHITGEEYINVLGTIGVAYFLRDAGVIRAIPESQIDMLRRVVGEVPEGALEVGPLQYEVGQQVEVIYGNLTGLRGTLVEKKGKHSLVIALEQFGLELRIEVRPEMVRPARH